MKVPFKKPDLRADGTLDTEKLFSELAELRKNLDHLRVKHLNTDRTMFNMEQAIDKYSSEHR